MKLLRAKLASVAVVLLVLTPLAVAIVAVAASSLSASHGRPLGKLNLESISLLPENGFSVLRLTGTAAGLGNCTGYGEIVINQDTRTGTGVVAFTAANGDMLVGVITTEVDSEEALSAEVHWRDSVTLNDGTTLASSGRFEKHRPAGLRMSYCCCCSICDPFLGCNLCCK
jgi:hypothetical protein